MIDISQQKSQANELRKLGKYEEALPLYRELWEKTQDKYDGAGLLQCLRKDGLFDEALVLADNLINRYPDFEWSRNESIWTYIQGTLSEDTPTKGIVDKANRIIELNPKGIALKVVVFKVLKSAKSSNHWGIVNEWVVKIDPSSLSSNTTSIDSGKERWSDQSLWYNYRIRGLLEKHDTKEELEEVLTLTEDASKKFPRQSKFFLRLQASAYFTLGQHGKSAEIYGALCSKHKPDWWILHEYAKVVQAQEHDYKALILMYQAASSHQKLEAMVSLFADIGLLCQKMEKYREARAHLVLCKYIREVRGWIIPETIVSTLDALNDFVDESEPSSQREAYDICQSEWRKLLIAEGLLLISEKKRKIREGIKGKVSLIDDERPFCFIDTEDQESFFCYKSDLPSNITNGDKVVFNALPSFDKKKNRESWKAINVRLLTPDTMTR